MIAEKTDSVLKREGMNVLIQKLGYVDAERFIALMSREPFDYTKWRQAHLEDDKVQSVSNKAMKYVSEKFGKS